MALNAGKIKQESNFKRPDPLTPGAYPARLVQIIDLGIQKQDAWDGEEKPPKPEVYTTYELVDEFLQDDDGNDIEDKPRWISERFTLNSLDSDLAKSTQRYLAIDPERQFGGDWSQLGGAPATVNIVNKKKKKDGSVYDKIGSVSGMRDKDAARLPELVNDVKIFDFDEPDMEVFGALPTWLQDVMKEALNFEGSALEKALGSDPAPKKEKPEATPEPEAEGDEDW